MPPYKLARLSDEQMLKIESLEHEIGVTLVAYEQGTTTEQGAAARGLSTGEEQQNLIDDALLDTYRTYDPAIYDPLI